MILHFPTDFPLDALAVLGPVIRSGGTITDKVTTGEAVFTLLGYGLGQVLGHEHNELEGPKVMATSPFATGEVSQEKALIALEALEPPAQDAPRVGRFDPRQLGKFALEIAKFIIPLLIKL